MKNPTNLKLVMMVMAILPSLHSFSQNTKDDPYEYRENGRPYCTKNEFIICFDPSVINMQAVYNLELQNATVGDFITTETIQNFIDSFGFDSGFAQIPLQRIYTQLTPDYSTSTARDGVTQVPIPTFWTTFLMTWQNYGNIDYRIVKKTLETHPKVVFTDFNYLVELHTNNPNDVHYVSNIQQGVGYYSGNTAINHIGCDEAWDYSVGSQNTKVGVFDSGINQLHEDLSFMGHKVVYGGYNYIGKTSLLTGTRNDNEGHGTTMAGIIGAVRNNETGIAGIVGGDYTTGKMGVKIYDMKTTNTSKGPLTAVLNAIVQGATQSTSGSGSYGFGLHVMNHSWGINMEVCKECSNPDFVEEVHSLREAIYFSSQNQCVNLASTGNIQDGVHQGDLWYPAQYRENSVLRVGGYQFDGGLWDGGLKTNLANETGQPSNPEGGIVAPATVDLYTSLKFDNNSGYNSPGNGTSVSCAFASGASALLLNYYKDYPYKPNELVGEDVYHLLKKYSAKKSFTSPDDGQFRFLDISKSNGGGFFAEIDFPKNRINHYDFVAPVSSFVGGLHYLHETEYFCVSAKKGVWCEDDATGAPVGLYCAATAGQGLNYENMCYTAKVYWAYVDVDLSAYATGSASIKDVWLRTFDCSLKPDWQLTSAAGTGFCQIADAGLPAFGLPSLGANHKYVIGKFYNITKNQWGGAVNYWYPFNPNKNTSRPLWFGLSIHTYDATRSGLNESGDQQIKFSIAPNPTSGKVMIKYESDSKEAVDVKVFDIVGREKQFTRVPLNIGENEIAIDLENLNSSIYLIKLTSSKGSSSKKIYVSR